MRHRRPSLLRRLTFFYAIFVSTALFAIASAIGIVIFENLTRAEATTLAAIARDVQTRVVGASARQTTVALQRAVARAARDGVRVLPIAMDMSAQKERLPPGDLSVGRLFGLYPTFVPLRDSTIVVVPDPQRLHETLHRFTITIATLLGTSLVIGWAVARLLARQTIKPLLTVTSELRRFETGDLSPRPIVSTDLTEFGDLAAAYNGAARQVASALQERRHAEDQMRQFVADAGHELRTPITVVAGYVDVLRRGGYADARVRALSFESLGFELKHMRALVERLMTLARLDRPFDVDDGIVDVRALVGQAVDSVAVMSEVAIHYRSDGDFFVRGEAGDVYEATANLLENAIKYGEGSDVDVALEMCGRDVVVRVRDGGPGIDQSHRQRIFERFYRATERSEIAGSGLGLAIAARAAERLRGRLELEDGRPKSTTFALIVPALAEDDRPP